MSVWNPPEFEVNNDPFLKETFKVHDNPEFPANFARSSKWAPDGSAFLASCEDRSLQLVETPSLSTYQGHFQTTTPNNTGSLNHRTHVYPQPASILDYAWYPSASSFDPSSFCFMASVRECPVKLLDGTDGRLRASYSIVDHRERQVAPHSMAFGGAGQRLYCGYDDAIELFEVSRPGEGTRLPTTPSKKSKDGLKGIISTLAVAPSQGSDFFAAGTFAQRESNIALFDQSQSEGPIMYISGGLAASVTQLRFNPIRPYLLYAAYRQQSSVHCWDLRSSIDTAVAIYAPSEPRRTNQKLEFDIDLGGKWLALGNEAGTLSMFDLSDLDEKGDAMLSSADKVPAMSFPAHKDSIGSAIFHPNHPLLLTTAGSRHFPEECNSTDSEPPSSDDGKSFSRPRQRRLPVPLDHAMKLWSFSI